MEKEKAKERGLEQWGRSNLATGRVHINASWVKGHTQFGIHKKRMLCIS